MGAGGGSWRVGGGKGELESREWEGGAEGSGGGGRGELKRPLKSHSLGVSFTLRRIILSTQFILALWYIFILVLWESHT